VTQEIYTIASALCGSLGAGEADCLQMLCQAAETEWEGRLKDGVTKTDCRQAFACAAAWTALAGFFSGRREEFSSFSAGDLRVESRSGTQDRQQAEDLLKQAERLMAPYCGDAGFVYGLWLTAALVAALLWLNLDFIKRVSKRT